MCSSSAASASGCSSQAPARRLRPASVIASSTPSSKRTASTADFGCDGPTASRPADIRCTISTGPAEEANSSRLARRLTSTKRSPTSDAIGGSIVFTVAKCAAGTDSIGRSHSRSRQTRTNASSSGSSGIDLYGTR